MSFIHIGNITLQTEWGATLLALLLFMLIEKFIRKKSSGWFQDVLINYILVWKLSYILFEFPLFISNPLSVLYFNGGSRGHILGLLVAFLLLVRKTKKNKEEIDWRNWLFSFSGFYLLFQASMYLFSKQMIVGILLIAVYILIIRRAANELNNMFIFILILLNSVLLAYEQNIFTIEGWTFTVICTVLLVILVWKDKRASKNIFSWLLIIILATAAVANFGSKNPQNNQKLTEKAVDFELKTLEGETVHLSDYKGKKVILNFWATWCPPCKAEMPHMQSFYEEHHDEVEIIAVNLTSRDNGEEAIESFIESNGLTFKIPLDEEGIYGEVYEAVTIPTSYIIDSKGRITQKVVGPMDEKMMENLVKDID